MADEVNLKEFIAGFLVEAEEHLALAHRALLSVDEAIKSGRLPARQTRELFRALHTIKGLAAMVGIEPIVELAHELETLLREADRSGGKLTSSAVDLLFKGVRAVEERVQELSRSQPVSPAPRALMEALTEYRWVEASGEPAPSPTLVSEDPLIDRLAPSERAQLEQGLSQGARAVRLDFQPTPARMAAGMTITTVRERLSELGELVKVLPLSVPRSDAAPGGLSFAILLLTARTDEELAEAVGLSLDNLRSLSAAAHEPARRPESPDLEEEPGLPTGPTRGLVRVDVTRLDDTLEKLSGLLVIRHRLERAVTALGARGADVRELQGIVYEASRQLRALRASIMAARMVPVSEVLERVPLMVRGLEKSTGKPLRLELELGNAELDKAVGERLFPAIVHLIRNAVDHGVESAEERQQRGKPVQATVRVSCHPRSNHQLELRVSDDGRGVDAAQVASKAGVELPRTAPELLALLTRPGLSTRGQADRTSGRGMGMDIVRKVVIEQLGGELDMDTTPGRGTTFIMQVPLSITIVDAFTFEISGERYAVPVSAVEEIVEVEPERLHQPPSPRPGAPSPPILERRGEAMTFFALDGVAPRKAIVIRRDGERVAFGVTRMLGQQEIVVRPLEDPLVHVTGVTGATDLGDGRPTLVLDLAGLRAARGSAR